MFLVHIYIALLNTTSEYYIDLSFTHEFSLNITDKIFNCGLVELYYKNRIKIDKVIFRIYSSIKIKGKTQKNTYLDAFINILDEASLSTSSSVIKNVIRKLTIYKERYSQNIEENIDADYLTKQILEYFITTVNTGLKLTRTEKTSIIEFLDSNSIQECCKVIDHGKYVLISKPNELLPQELTNITFTEFKAKKNTIIKNTKIYIKLGHPLLCFFIVLLNNLKATMTKYNECVQSKQFELDQFVTFYLQKEIDEKIDALKDKIEFEWRDMDRNLSIVRPAGTHVCNMNKACFTFILRYLVEIYGYEVELVNVTMAHFGPLYDEICMFMIGILFGPNVIYNGETVHNDIVQLPIATYIYRI